MQRTLIAFLVLFFFAMVSCSSPTAEKKESDAPAKKALVPEVTATAAFNVSIDSLTPEQKEAQLNSASVSSAEWRDTYCPVCSSRCCSPCTAGGNPSQCAETRFRECSRCGHASSGHYSVRH